MKLEVGMYVRTESGLIAKYIEINNDYKWHVFDDSIQWFYEYYREEIDFDSWEEFIKEKVVKASHNIIDLIEVGDYVNGVMVESMNNSIKPTPIPQYKNECGEYVDFDESDIKSIVTKELFENMSYLLEKESDK